MDDADFDELYLDLMKEFLSTATPVEWLAVVTTMNYDGNGALVDWIIKQPKLEPAVAKARPIATAAVWMRASMGYPFSPSMSRQPHRNSREDRARAHKGGISAARIRQNCRNTRSRRGSIQSDSGEPSLSFLALSRRAGGLR